MSFFHLQNLFRLQLEHWTKCVSIATGAAAGSSAHEATADENLSKNSLAEKRAVTHSPAEDRAGAGSPVSSSNSHLGPVSPLSDSANTPVMWFNGAAADSEHSEGNPAQTLQAECSSSEPQAVAAVSSEPTGTSAVDSKHTMEDEGHHPSMPSASQKEHSQQPGHEVVYLQPSSMTNDLHIAQPQDQYQDQDQAAPNLIQSAESLSAWLGSRTASLDANDAPESLAPIAEAGSSSDVTAVSVQHSPQAATATAVAETEPEVSTSSEKHVQDSYQYAAARPSWTAECCNGNCEDANDAGQQAPAALTSARAVKRYGQLSVSHEASGENTEPECDIYNLESPGPILIAGQHGALVRQHPLFQLYLLLR